MSNEIIQDATVFVDGAVPLKDCGLHITVSQKWRDPDDDPQVLLSCGCGWQGVEYSLSLETAEALGLLLQSTARKMRRLHEWCLEREAIEEAVEHAKEVE